MNEKSETQIITLGGGCFWCLEAIFEPLPGVLEVVSGYAGGHVAHPTYEQVCGKQTGHAEVIQISFDPEQISFRQILEVFFTLHDPTTPNRQGADVGPQYRSIILYGSPEQKRTAEQVIAELEAEGAWGAPIVTEVARLSEFYPAEACHRQYFRRHPEQGYCRMVIAPKVAKLREKYLDRLKNAP
jgi:peptide-methionine (S)-S-oxide reductase